jgi:hypothetical protein
LEKSKLNRSGGGDGLDEGGRQSASGILPEDQTEKQYDPRF